MTGGRGWFALGVIGWALSFAFVANDYAFDVDGPFFDRWSGQIPPVNDLAGWTPLVLLAASAIALTRPLAARLILIVLLVPATLYAFSIALVFALGGIPVGNGSYDIGRHASGAALFACALAPVFAWQQVKR